MADQRRCDPFAQIAGKKDKRLAIARIIPWSNGNLREPSEGPYKICFIRKRCREIDAANGALKDIERQGGQKRGCYFTSPSSEEYGTSVQSVPQMRKGVPQTTVVSRIVLNKQCKKLL